MVDVARSARLRGFDSSLEDIGDQVHFCHPLLSFEDDSQLYVARRLDWRHDPKALAVADPTEAATLATLLPQTQTQPIVSGDGLIAVGSEFLRAVETAGLGPLNREMNWTQVGDPGCRIALASMAHYTQIKNKLTEDALSAFDKALGEAARFGEVLSERGNAALLLLRRCGPRRRDDLAIRQLAGAYQNQEHDLYRRLLIRFSLELDTPEDRLHKRVMRHMNLTSTTAVQALQTRDLPSSEVTRTSLPHYQNNESIRDKILRSIIQAEKKTPRERTPSFVKNIRDPNNSERIARPSAIKMVMKHVYEQQETA